MAGKAAKELTEDEPKRARDVIGGLYGDLSVMDTYRAKAAYDEYASNATEEPLPFAEWVRKFYK